MKANKFLRNNEGYTNLVPMVLAIVIVFAVLFVGIYINGAINQSLSNTYPSSASKRSPMQNTSLKRMANISQNQDSALSIVQVVIIITILAGAIAAIFLFTRFRGGA